MVQHGRRAWARAMRRVRIRVRAVPLDGQQPLEVHLLRELPEHAPPADPPAVAQHPHYLRTKLAGEDCRCLQWYAFVGKAGVSMLHGYLVPAADLHTQGSTWGVT